MFFLKKNSAPIYDHDEKTLIWTAPKQTEKVDDYECPDGFERKGKFCQGNKKTDGL